MLVSFAEQASVALAAASERGYAVAEELEAGTTSVAAAITPPSGTTVAAIGVCGATARLRAGGLDALGEMAGLFAAEVAGQLAREPARPATPIDA